MRTAARECAFKAVFASVFTGETDSGLVKSMIKADKLDEDDCAYLNRVISLVGGHREELLRLLDRHSRSFPEARLFPADKSVLLVALAEILYMDDIPAVVSVNEAANISSKYSSPKSASFVSGILSEVIKEK